MPTTYTVGYGSQIYYGTRGGTPATKVAQTRDIKGPSPEVGDVKLTNNDSPNNTKEYGPGMLEPGEVDWECLDQTIYQRATRSQSLPHRCTPLPCFCTP